MPESRIEEMTLRGVGPFVDTRIVFGKPLAEGKANIHVFTGPNGSGKTTALEALATIFRDGDDFGGLGPRLQKDARVQFCFGGLKGAFGLATSSGKNMTFFEKGRYFEGDAPDYKWSQGTHARMSLAAITYSGYRHLEVQPLTAIQPVKVDPFEKALAFGESVRADLLLQWIANNRTQWALAKAEGSEADAQVYEQSLQRITDFMARVCGLQLEFRLRRSPLEVVLTVNEQEVPINTLPDGLKSILSWVGDLVMRLDRIRWETPGDILAQRVFLFLDEIDIHLHPKWQRLILPAVQDLLPKSEVFVSTHSPFVVGSVENAWVYKFPERGTAALIEPIPSGAGKSYAAILEEVFAVEEEFDPHTVALLEKFYQARDAVLASKNGLSEFKSLAAELSRRSEELKAIVAREIRQTERRSGTEICLD